MDSFFHLQAASGRPRRQRVSSQDWRQQALNRLLELARHVGLSEEKLLRLAGVDAFEQLGLAKIGVLADELNFKNRGGWG